MLQVLVQDDSRHDGWLPLDGGMLTIGAETLAQTQGSMKKVTVGNVYIPGTYTVRAVPDNTKEKIVVIVHHPDYGVRTDTIDYLVALFTRPRFQLQVSSERAAYIMSAQCADGYAVNNQREYLHGGIGSVSFDVPILPGRLKVAA